MPQARRIDRASIVSAAIDVLDEGGLDQLSLRTIAARVGVREPALYHHVGSKAALLSAVVDEVLARNHTERTPNPGEAWDAFLTRNARSLRRAMLSVRDGARLISSAGGRVPNPQNAIAQIEVLERAGFALRDAIEALIAVSRYAIGSAVEEQAGRAVERGDDDLPGSDDPRFARIVREVGRLDADREFEVGLSALLRGFRGALPGAG
jgi:TetR/AcrR family tetracycline transcriptional repressor